MHRREGENLYGVDDGELGKKDPYPPQDPVWPSSHNSEGGGVEPSSEPEPGHEPPPEPEPDPSTSSENVNEATTVFVFDSEQTIGEFQLLHGGDRSEWDMKFAESTGQMRLDPETGDMMVGSRNHTKEIYATGTAEQIAEHEELREVMRQDVGYVHTKMFTEKRAGREFISVVRFWVIERGVAGMCHAMREVAPEEEKDIKEGNEEEMIYNEGASSFSSLNGVRGVMPNELPASTTESLFVFATEGAVAVQPAVGGEIGEQEKPSWFDTLFDSTGIREAQTSPQSEYSFLWPPAPVAPTVERVVQTPIVFTAEASVPRKEPNSVLAADSGGASRVEVASGTLQTAAPQETVPHALREGIEVQNSLPVFEGRIDVVPVVSANETGVVVVLEKKVEPAIVDEFEPLLLEVVAEESNLAPSVAAPSVGKKERSKPVQVPVSEPSSFSEVLVDISQKGEVRGLDETEPVEELGIEITVKKNNVPETRFAENRDVVSGFVSEPVVKIEHVASLRVEQKKVEQPASQHAEQKISFGETAHDTGISLAKKEVARLPVDVKEDPFEKNIDRIQSVSVEREGDPEPISEEPPVSFAPVSKTKQLSPRELFVQSVWQETGIGIVEYSEPDTVADSSQKTPTHHDKTIERPVLLPEVPVHDTAPLFSSNEMLVEQEFIRGDQSGEAPVFYATSVEKTDAVVAPSFPIEVQAIRVEDVVVSAQSISESRSTTTVAVPEFSRVVTSQPSERAPVHTSTHVEKGNVSFINKEKPRERASIDLLNDTTTIRREKFVPERGVLSQSVTSGVVHEIRKDTAPRRFSSLEGAREQTVFQSIPRKTAEEYRRLPAAVIRPPAPLAFVESLLSRFRGRASGKDSTDELSDYRQGPRGQYVQRPAPRKLAA